MQCYVQKYTQTKIIIFLIASYKKIMFVKNCILFQQSSIPNINKRTFISLKLLQNAGKYSNIQSMILNLVLAQLISNLLYQSYAKNPYSIR